MAARFSGFEQVCSHGTPLDGTAKGGVLAAIAKEFPTPVRFIGVGEGIDDLREFNAKEYAEGMFE